MKKNVLLLTLVVLGSPIAAMQQNPEALLKNAQEQQTHSKQDTLKKYGSLCLGFLAGYTAKKQFHDQIFYEKTMLPKWGYKNDGKDSLKLLATAKYHRNLAIASTLVSGLFFYNALSGFTGKKLNVKIVNNDESK